MAELLAYNKILKKELGIMGIEADEDYHVGKDGRFK
jgi:hypothetical protein